MCFNFIYKIFSRTAITAGNSRLYSLQGAKPFDILHKKYLIHWVYYLLGISENIQNRKTEIFPVDNLVFSIYSDVAKGNKERRCGRVKKLAFILIAAIAAVALHTIFSRRKWTM